MKKIKWYEEDENVVSGMRIMAMMSTCTGCASVVCGVVGWFLRIPEAATIITVGAGMCGLGEIAKAWQAKGE